jgi:hypothetical protein
LGTFSLVGGYGILVGGTGGRSLRGHWQSCVILVSDGGDSVVSSASPTVGNCQDMIPKALHASLERKSLSVLSVK